jgi:integrase
VKRHLADRARQEAREALALHSDVAVVELIPPYVVHCESYYVKGGKPTSQVGLVKAALRVLRQKVGDMEANHFTPMMLEQCRDQYVADGLTRREVNRRVGLVRQFFRWCAAKGRIDPSVWTGLGALEALREGRTEAPDPPPIGPVPDDVVDRTLPELSATVDAMVQFQRLTGARPDEVCQMTGSDLVMAEPVWEYRPRSHKNSHRGKHRIIAIGPKARAILKPLLRTDLNAAVFPTPRGRHYSTGTYRNAVQRACRRAHPHPTLSQIPADEMTADQQTELREWHRQHQWAPNQLRHSTATKLRREVGLESARVVLGHSDSDTTTIYAERDIDLAREVMARLG